MRETRTNNSAGKAPREEYRQNEDPANTRPRRRRRTGRVSNREYTVITYFFVLLFLALMIWYSYFQIKLSDRYLSSSYNSLQDLFSEYVKKGEILSSDGEVLAQTVTDGEGNTTRVYPYGRVFAHVVGYSVNGRSGLESSCNYNLYRSHVFILEQIWNDLQDKKNDGDNVVTSLDTGVQQAAYDALGNYQGAAIAIEPSTGRILAVVSKPDFDPSRVEENWDSLNAEGSSVLYNRATQGQYAPGSTFKILTLLEYYREHQKDWQNYSYACDGDITVDGTTIHCAGSTAHGTESLMESFANSCNCSFANIGLSMKVNKLEDLCSSLMFNQSLPVDFTCSKSLFSLDDSSAGLVMQTTIGQGNTLVTPLEMAMISATVCNGGEMMLPRLVDRVENAGGVEVSSEKSESLGNVLTTEEAAFLEDSMKAVVEEGTGRKLSGLAYQAYGKTGTAQTSESLTETNAWFTGYARMDGKEIAVAVIVENSGAGSTYALPVAKAMFDAWLGQ